jgi:hypothetical protein
VVVVTNSIGVADLLPSRAAPPRRVAARRGPGVEVLKGSILTEQAF